MENHDTADLCLLGPFYHNWYEAIKMADDIHLLCKTPPCRRIQTIQCRLVSWEPLGPSGLGTGGSAWTSELVIPGTGFALCALSWHPTCQFYLSMTVLEDLLRHLAGLTSFESEDREWLLVLDQSSTAIISSLIVLPLGCSAQVQDSNSAPVQTGSSTEAVILRPQERELLSMHAPVLPGLMQLQGLGSTLFDLWQNRRKYIARPYNPFYQVQLGEGKKENGP